jgi:polysaccharide pyruvyl transferase WcaK-like protein
LNKSVETILWGGYGGGNVGDKLTLAVALHDARKRFGDSVCVLSADPEGTRKFFPDVLVAPFEPRADAGLRRLVRSLSRRVQLDGWYLSKFPLSDQPSSPWLELIQQSRHLYLVGGGYLTGMFKPDYYLLPVLAAKAAAVPVSSAPVGIGPFNNSGEAAFVAEALRGTDLAVRDAASLAFCRERGLPARQALDDGFRVAEVIPGLARRASAGNRLKIGVCIYPQHGDPDWPRTKRWWAGLLAALRAEEVSGFCFHADESLDYATTRELLGDGRVKPWKTDLREAMETLCGFDVIVSARFHAVVVANVLGIPNIAVAGGEYYRAKMTAAKRPQDTQCHVVDPSTELPEETARRLLA